LKWRASFQLARNSEGKKERFKIPPEFLPASGGLPRDLAPAGGKKAERGEKRILGASQGRSATAGRISCRFVQKKFAQNVKYHRQFSLFVKS